MNIRLLKKSINLSSSAILAGLMVTSAYPAHAAPGAIANTPLYLSTAVEPNIFFLNDDSGSMDWSLMTSTTNCTWPGIMCVDNVDYYHTHYDPTNISPFTRIVPSEDYLLTRGESLPVDGVWRAWNSSYNKIYYNPLVTYTPWAGKDDTGTAYGNSNPAAARYNPYDASDGTRDLTTTMSYSSRWEGSNITVTNFYPARYYTWTDTDGDGIVDASDGHTLVEIRSTTSTYTGGADRSDCAAAPTCTYAEEIQNFANWFTYYRKREYTAKNAIGSVISSASFARMGYATINDNSEEKIKIATMTSATNKDTLLDRVSQTHSEGGTPLRQKLRDVGRYYECKSGNIFDSTSNCPILDEASGGTCQQNYTILMTDGHWNGGDPNMSSESGKGNDNMDGDNDTEFDGGTYADSHHDTLADVAMHFYEEDLDGTLDDDVPVTLGVDEADHQHMVTYTVSFGLTGTLDPDTQDPADDGFSWPDPYDGEDEKIDDLWHAAYNGRGQFLTAQNPEELTSALSSAITNITDRTSTAAAVAFNSTTLGTDSFLYLARFNTAKWSGDLLSFALDPVSGDVAASHTWSAATVLDARDLVSNSRKILTYNGTAGIPFQWNSLTSAQKNDLKTNSSGGTDSDTIGEERLDYLRGDRSNEGSDATSYRARNSRLGDIVQSNPVYVGKPELNYPSTAPFPTTAGETYEDYKTAQADRSGVVYVGANDGMLHGFDGETGAEVLAYVPNYLYSTTTSEGLHFLTHQNYSHRYYNDLSPTVADAYIQTTVGGTTAWRTVLIGGARGGARGLFALDVTSPSAFSETGSTPDDIVMWEFTNADDADLGYTFSKPTMALMNDGKWAAVVGNGYNNTGDGEAKLFILYLDGGIDGSWTAGTDYVEITTGVGSIANGDCQDAGSDCNGLSTPALADTDGDGDVDRVYAGDLKGNLWVFDVENASASNWGMAYEQGSTPKPMFTAANDSAEVQPITVKPVLAKHTTESDSGNGENIMVFFGTGQYITETDKTSTDVQTFYGVWDHGSKELDRTDLVEQTFESGFASNVRVPTNNSISWSGGGAKHGWYIDLPDSGERVVANPRVRGDFVFFNTLIPSSSACSFGGSGWLMAVKQYNGGQPDDPVFDVNNDGAVDDSGTTDQVSNDDGSTYANAGGRSFGEGIPTESNFLGDNQYTPGSSGDIDKGTIDTGDPGIGTGRLSWEELQR